MDYIELLSNVIIFEKEIWPITKDKRNNTRIVRWTCSARAKERISAVGLKINQYLNIMRNASKSIIKTCLTHRCMENRSKYDTLFLTF